MVTEFQRRLTARCSNATMAVVAGTLGVRSADTALAEDGVTARTT